MKKPTIIKKTEFQKCWSCEGRGCKACNQSGQWQESINYIIYTKKVRNFVLILIISDN